MRVVASNGMLSLLMWREGKQGYARRGTGCGTGRGKNAGAETEVRCRCTIIRRPTSSEEELSEQVLSVYTSEWMMKSPRTVSQGKTKTKQKIVIGNGGNWEEGRNVGCSWLLTISVGEVDEDANAILVVLKAPRMQRRTVGQISNRNESLIWLKGRRRRRGRRP